METEKRGQGLQAEKLSYDWQETWEKIKVPLKGRMRKGSKTTLNKKGSRVGIKKEKELMMGKRKDKGTKIPEAGGGLSVGVRGKWAWARGLKRGPKFQIQ